MTDITVIIGTASTVAQAVILATLIIMMFFVASGGKNIILLVFYGFALNSFLLSDLFWIVYNWLRPDTRMPFAANEFGECAFFLLSAAALAYVFRSNKHISKEAVIAVIFVAANTALWYGWSGEFVQDILTGVCIGYFVFVSVNSAKHCNALEKVEWTALGTGSFLLAAMQASTFFLPKNVAALVDKCCYVLIFAGILFFVVKTVLAVALQKKDTEQALCIVWMCVCWVVLSLYMSSGLFYTIILITLTALLPFTYTAVRREALK